MVEPTLLIRPALALGVLIGLYEGLLIHRDVQVHSHRFGHTIHGIIFAAIAVFASMNVDYVLAAIPALQSIPYVENPLTLRILIGLVVLFKIGGISAAVHGSNLGGAGTVGLKEKFSHSLVIAALVVAAPYVYPAIEPALPDWARD